MEDVVSDAKATFLDRNLNVAPGGVRAGEAEDASQATLEGSLHLFCTVEVSVGRHRVGVVDDQAPPQAEAEENEGGGCELEADESGLDPVSSAVRAC